MGYGGDLVALFKSFDKNNRGVVGLEEWSPDAAELVFGFKEHLVKTYGSVKDGWIKCLDSHKVGRVSKEAFMAACETMGGGFDAEKLFALIDYDRSGFLSLEEIDSRAAAGLKEKSDRRSTADSAVTFA